VCRIHELQIGHERKPSHLGAVTSPASWYTINPVLMAFLKLKPLAMKLKRQGYYEYKRAPLQKIPIAKIDPQSTLYLEIINNVKELLKLKKIYYSNISTFQRMIQNYSDPFTEQRMLSDYIYRADYQVDLINTRKFIDDSVSGKVTEIKISKNRNYLALTATYETNKENDIMHIYVRDNAILDYFYYCTKIFLKKKYARRDWGSGNVIDVVLKAIRIPKFSRFIEIDKKRILDLMTEFYNSEVAGNRDLNNIESRISSLQKDLDNAAYTCYSLSPTQIKVIEEFMAQKAIEISRIF
jgi:hypothetical protein